LPLNNGSPTGKIGKFLIKNKNDRINAEKKPRVIRICTHPKWIPGVRDGVTNTNFSSHNPLKETVAINAIIGVVILFVFGRSVTRGKKKQQEITTHERVLNGSSCTRLITNPVSSGMFPYQITRN
jgi:hypothetical protein